MQMPIRHPAATGWAKRGSIPRYEAIAYVRRIIIAAATQVATLSAKGGFERWRIFIDATAMRLPIRPTAAIRIGNAAKAIGFAEMAKPEIEAVAEVVAAKAMDAIMEPQ